MKIKCHNCGYEWDTSSEMNMVTCPSCGYKTPREKETAKVTESKAVNQIHEEKSPKGVRKLDKTPKIGIAVVVVAIIAIGAYVALTPVEEPVDDDGTPTEGATWGPGLFGYTQENGGGLLGIYILDNSTNTTGVDPWNYSDANIFDSATNPVGDRDSVTLEIPPQQGFKIAIHAVGLADNMANVDPENIRVELEATGDLTIPTENLQGTQFDWTETNADNVEVSAVWRKDTNGDNLILAGNDSFNWESSVYLWMPTA